MKILIKTDANWASMMMYWNFEMYNKIIITLIISNTWIDQNGILEDVRL